MSHLDLIFIIALAKVQNNYDITKGNVWKVFVCPLQFVCKDADSCLILRSFSEVTPSILHRYSIVSPSFRWRIDGGTMDLRWSIISIIIYSSCFFLWNKDENLAIWYFCYTFAGENQNQCKMKGIKYIQKGGWEKTQKHKQQWLHNQFPLH